jgi:hypothetical protein
MRHTWLKVLLVVVLTFAVVPTVSADELWIENQGGLEVVIEYEGDVSLGEVGGIAAINPNYGDGTAKVATATLETEWVVISADTITGYDIEVACNQQLEDVTPEVFVVIDYEGTRISYNPAETTREAVIAALDIVGPPPPPPDATNNQTWVDPVPITADYEDDGGGQSIADMNVEKAIIYDWSGQEVWLYT